jgi:hypothetical protein
MLNTHIDFKNYTNFKDRLGSISYLNKVTIPTQCLSKGKINMY